MGGAGDLLGLGVRFLGSFTVLAGIAILGGAATPGALFAIGASLASKSAERLYVASWLSFSKLALHPAAVSISALWVFDVDPSAAGGGDDHP